MDLSNGVESLEVGLLLEAIFRCFGNDFRHHNKNFIRHKLRGFMETHSIATLSALQEKILHDSTFVEPLLCALDERASRLFDHPEQILKLRKTLIPWLRSCPAPKIWVAECVSAEEVFGLVILLLEEDLHHKTQLYVTGPNANLLAQARLGRFSANLYAQYEENYYQAGGVNSLANYCARIEDTFVFNSELHSNITWVQYNLGTDASLNEFEAIVCCGGLSGFTLHLRNRAIRLFYESQPVFGVLTILGDDSLEITPFISRYKVISEKYGLYQRVAN
jgi:chemotaxis protein methyltransferase CheR